MAFALPVRATGDGPSARDRVLIPTIAIDRCMMRNDAHRGLREECAGRPLRWAWSVGLFGRMKFSRKEWPCRWRGEGAEICLHGSVMDVGDAGQPLHTLLPLHHVIRRFGTEEAIVSIGALA
jgi:hypothetical protein